MRKHPRSFNHLNEFLILPTTEDNLRNIQVVTCLIAKLRIQDQDCSAVELVAEKPQSSVLFISSRLSRCMQHDKFTFSHCWDPGHRWGDLLVDFLDCLTSYYRAKELREDPSLLRIRCHSPHCLGAIFQQW